jgi:predicted nuclease with TOPRIM domain
MRKVLLVLSLLALTGLYACESQEEELKQEIKELEEKVQAQDKKLQTQEAQIDEYSTTIIELRNVKDALEAARELGSIEISDLKWKIDDDDFKLILYGTVKNTGKAYLHDVTVKVEIRDKTDNVIDAKIINDPDRENMKMLFYHNVAGSLDQNDSQDFALVIYTRDIHDDALGRVKDAIGTMGDPEPQVKVTGLFISAR